MFGRNTVFERSIVVFATPVLTDSCVEHRIFSSADAFIVPSTDRRHLISNLQYSTVYHSLISAKAFQ